MKRLEPGSDKMEGSDLILAEPEKKAKKKKKSATKRTKSASVSRTKSATRR